MVYRNINGRVLRSQNRTDGSVDLDEAAQDETPHLHIRRLQIQLFSFTGPYCGMQLHSSGHKNNHSFNNFKNGFFLIHEVGMRINS